jgi:hypothetical protein
MVLKYPVTMVNYSSREDVVMSLNGLPGISADYISTSIGKGFIAVSVDEDVFMADDILSLGAYIGQIETMQLM